MYFSHTNGANFDDVRAKWRPGHGATARPCVVGTEAESKGVAVSEIEGRAMAARIGAVAYLGCSTLAAGAQGSLRRGVPDCAPLRSMVQRAGKASAERDDVLVNARAGSRG
jgi:hypothetical protein